MNTLLEKKKKRQKRDLQHQENAFCAQKLYIFNQKLNSVNILLINCPKGE